MFRQNFRSVYILMLLSTLIFFGVISLGYAYYSTNSKEEYLNQSNTSYSDSINLTLNQYQEFSSYIFETLLDDSVLSLMYQGAFGDENEKNAARLMLYETLEEDYQFMTQYNFRQLHFHLPNGDSFLRFHTPETYGDNLWDVRSSIRIVNSELRRVTGFEEGRIYNGYRFLYPLFYQDEHVGSVEISVSIATVIDALFTIKPKSIHNFMIKKDVVDNLVFDEFLDNYQTCPICEDYYVDINVDALFQDRRTFLVDEELNDFLLMIKPKVSDSLSKETSFSYTTDYNKNQITLHFISIKNIDENHIGYIFEILIDDKYKELMLQDFGAYASFGFFSMLIFIVLMMYARDKEKIKDVSKIDYLTKLNNRKHFIDVAENILSRSIRQSQSIFIIMMDIDFFKQINDSVGHAKGDEVLVKIAHCIKTNIGAQDIAARWGGEEFILLIRNKNKTEMLQIIKKIQSELLNLQIEQVEKITMSFGIAVSNATDDLDGLINLADEKMYYAKENGRNQYVF